MSVVSANVKNLVPRLEKRGPHRVLVGELDFAGLPGRVYTPAEGKAVAGVAFGHDWRVGVDAYHATLRHLASWGIAVAAPDTERGLLPNHRGFASDLESSLQILSGVRLGVGHITVDPNKLFFAGHGMGAGAAVLAATGRAPAQHAKKHYRDRPTVAGVLAVHPSDTSPSCYQAARHVHTPGLVLAPGKTSGIEPGEPERVAALWGGPMVFRRISKATSAGFQEKLIRKYALTNGRAEFAAQDFIRSLMTGFILAEDDRTYRDFRDPEAQIKRSETATRGELFENLPEFADPMDAVNRALKV